ncbi:hypothetical protein [Clostridium sp. HMSC19A10]|uniref:hypothetical protein n=1 Tax=Clostridium sp. HMSC19A10 TaxID=1581148 RepID=UPI0008A32A1D|nr:hypothetical protein [Clostridium sp. HMSC19A10]OFS24186.1 hypothetical protein HMPREF3070_05910 [Clostridium sp. HMSC19A10]
MLENFKYTICEKFDHLALEDKLLIGKAISFSVQPLILLKKEPQLVDIYNEYLNKIPVEECDGEKVYKEYTTKVKEYFEYEEYDELSYSSYNDKEFCDYLSFMAVQILANTLRTYKSSFIEIAVNYLVEVSIVLDDYFYYLNKDNCTLEGLDNILKHISVRVMQDACEQLLINSIRICEEGGDKKVERLLAEEKKFKHNIKKVLEKQ